MKKVHKCFYVHISAISQLEEKFRGTSLYNYMINRVLPDFEKKARELCIPFSMREEAPIVIKYDTEKNSITILYAIDWITANEPEIVGAWLYKMGDSKVVYQRGKGQIYHSKELFVLPTYRAFDLEKAKRRTVEWNRYIQQGDKSRIGYKKYWIEFLSKHGLEL